MSKRKCWRLSLGERGCRVVLFERTPGGPLYREVYIGGTRVASKKALKHRDQERAKVDAYELLKALKAREDALRGERLTLRTLFDMYVGSPSFEAKKDRTQRGDRAKLELVMDFLGADRDVSTLSESDAEEYKQARMRGEYGPARQKVRARTVAADLVALTTMLNWATRQHRVPGRFLLDQNPLRGLRLPTEKNPRRPITTWDRYTKTREALSKLANASKGEAERRRWVKIEMALVLAEATGRRLGSIRHLRWEDIDFQKRKIQWQADADKRGVEWVTDITVSLAKELRRFRRQLGAVAGFLFSAEIEQDRPMDRHLFDKWLAYAEEAAGLPKLKGGLWHPYRRKWATERKHHSVKDVAAVGGWKDCDTILRCYQQPDRETMLAVVNEPRKVRDGTVG